MMITAVLSLFLVAFLLRRLVSAPDGRLPPGDWAARADLEMGRLRDEVERLSGEVRRLEEEQSFLLRLVEGKERSALERGSESGPRGPDAAPGGPAA